MARASSKPPYQQKRTPRLDRRQRVTWLRLIRSENVGPATFRALVNQFGARAGRGRARTEPGGYRRIDPCDPRVATRKVHIVLLELDLAGRLQRHGQQLVSLKV